MAASLSPGRYVRGAATSFGVHWILGFPGALEIQSSSYKSSDEGTQIMEIAGAWLHEQRSTSNARQSIIFLAETADDGV